MTEHLAVGYIFSVKGLKGEVKVKSLTSKERFYSGSSLQITPPVVGLEKLVIEKANKSADNYVLKFKEINSIEEASKIKNHYLEVEKTPLPKDKFYIDDLIGLEVISDKGISLGSVSEVLESKAHDIIFVKGKNELNIPLTSKYIEKIDINNGKIIVKEIEGLLEL